MLMSKVALWSEGGDCHVRLHRASLRSPDGYEQLFKILPAREQELFCPIRSVTALVSPEPWRLELRAGKAQ